MSTTANPPTMRTGSRRIVVNVWSEEARQAAIESRRSHAKGDNPLEEIHRAVVARQKQQMRTGSKNVSASTAYDDTPAHHLERAGYHDAKAQDIEKRSGGRETDESKSHREAAALHREAAKCESVG